MTRRIAVITGTTGGIGAVLATRLAAENWQVVMLNRDSMRADALRRRIQESHPEATVSCVPCDLASHGSVRTACAAVSERFPKIDAVFNNAGVLLGSHVQSVHGNEMHFEVNTLAPYMITKLLYPALLSAKGRVINTSSGVISSQRHLWLERIQNPDRFVKLFGAYAQSKLALTTLTNAMAAQYSNDGVILRSVEPGPNKTSMTAGDGMPWFISLLRPIIFRPPEVGATHLYDACFDNRFDNETGLFIATGKVKKPPLCTFDRSTRSELLALCERLCGV
jgi:NAD(P)-dependent dehydrogenase (short-subunit alcohol dehydrogenase family)